MVVVFDTVLARIVYTIYRMQDVTRTGLNSPHFFTTFSRINTVKYIYMYVFSYGFNHCIFSFTVLV